MKDIKKKLVKQVKRSRPSLAQEIKDMPMKDFRALWFVVQQGLKVKKKHWWKKFMTKKERDELKQDLDLLTKEELIEILLDHEEKRS